MQPRLVLVAFDDLTQAGDVDADSNVVTRGLRVQRAFDSAFQPTARADVPEIGGTTLDAL